ncbi:MAG: choice-of-anchor tandem repeat GloVer-containing protein, partial [Flavobacteriales bacterium]
MRFLYLSALSFMFSFNLQAQNYELWGMTSGGHPEDDYIDVLYDEGVIFSLGEDEANHEVHYSLRYQGRRPSLSTPTEASNGKFYCMTRFGGIYDDGVLYEYDKEFGHYRKLHDFQNVESGKEPFGSVYQASDGKLYGATKQGGEHDHGVFFSYDLSNNTYTKLLDFLDDDYGKFPYGTPYEAQTGKLIGMTNSGGDFNQGVIYEYNIALGTFQVLLHFTSVDTGGHPRGDFIEANNGMLYGVTNDGGAANHGVIFEYDAGNNLLTKIHDFDQLTTGQFPACKMVQATNGRLYGTTSTGGTNNHGVLFEYDLSNGTFSNLFEFNSALTGEAPSGGLVQAENGLLYGTTQYGG